MPLEHGVLQHNGKHASVVQSGTAGQMRPQLPVTSNNASCDVVVTSNGSVPFCHKYILYLYLYCILKIL